MTDQFKILWLKTGLLHPLDTGGKLRTFNMLKVLNRRHKITYLAFSLPETSEESKKKASEYSSSQVLIPFNEAKKRSPKFYCELFLNLFSKYPYAVEKYKSDLMTKAIAEMESDFDIVVCDFLAPSINWIRATKQPSKSLLFQHNVEALIWKRLAENSNSYFTHLYLKSQWKRMRNFEKNASARFGGVVGVSDEDCRIMREEYGLTNVLGSVPTGVDIEYFRPDGRAPEQGYILFLGSMDWMPNIDAVQYFVNSIYPIIKGKYPSAKFVIVGRNPVKSVNELADNDKSIFVTGTVDDVRPYLKKASVMVVPLRAGGGTRIKIYEAMAAGVPVVSTSVGAEGLAVENNKHILIGDSPDDFADKTIRILNNELPEISSNARRLVEENFSWEKVTELFEEYCKTIIQKNINGSLK